MNTEKLNKNLDDITPEDIRSDFHEVIKAFREEEERNPMTETEIKEAQELLERLSEQYDLKF